MIINDLFKPRKFVAENSKDEKQQTNGDNKPSKNSHMQFGSAPDDKVKDSIFNYKGIFPDIKLLAIRAREAFPVATNDLEAILKYLNQHRVEGEREIDALEDENKQQEKIIRSLQRTEALLKAQLEQDEAFEQLLKAELDRQHDTDEKLKKAVQALLDKEKRFADYAKQMAVAKPEERSQTWHDLSSAAAAAGEVGGPAASAERHL